MSDLKARFEEAVVQSKSLTSRPDNATMLKLYAYFKQANDGDVRDNRPDVFDALGTAKYDAWEAIGGTSREDAMTAYVTLIDKLKSA